MHNAATIGLRVAIYRRVSEITTTNVAGSLTDQYLRCKTYAEQQQWIVVRDYEEAGKSAFNEKNLGKRVQYQQMLIEAKAGKFDVVLVWKYDRFSRRMRIALQAQYDLEAANIAVVSVTEPFDTRTASGRFGVRNMLNAAELFSDMHGERMKSARASEALRGRHVGPTPIGYRKVDIGQLDRDEPYDVLVYQALTLYATGAYSPARIAQHLHATGYTLPDNRVLVNKKTIFLIVHNAPLYAGYVRSAGVWIRGNHPAIIDDATCTRVLATIERRSVAQDRRYARTQEPSAMLAGLVYCEACRQQEQDSKMHIHFDKRKDPPYRTFRCRRRGDAFGCLSKTANAAALDAQILALVDALVLPDAWYEEAIEIAQQQLAVQPAPRPATDPAKVHERIRRLAQLYQDGVKSDEEYQRELATLRAQLTDQPARVPVRRASIEDVVHRLRDLPALLQAGTVAEQRAVLMEVLDQVYADRHTVAAIRPTALYEALLLAAQNTVASGEYLPAAHRAASRFLCQT